MAYKCPSCGYVANAAFSRMQLSNVICDQCHLSTSDALLRTQDDLVIQFAAYSIGHDDRRVPADDSLVIKHTPFASSAAHTIRILPSHSNASISQGNTANSGSWPAEIFSGDYGSPSGPTHPMDNQMNYRQETAMAEERSEHGGKDKSQHVGTVDIDMTAAADTSDLFYENAAAEPYMFLGYGSESRSGGSWDRRELPQDVWSRKHATSMSYRPCNDPVFNRHQWWE
ncbi:hypothetical protein BGW36DRAFT_383174 [Talaromyces proteolyticus]|uniref:Uncharacterized protein n=1 Tax=Talaromyces proteolyticus TaxID=1131652 RepID=A0AAD4KM64_9EURO|nr:uncharacterized protein BGW36DRAFT_383174 [Talaromyces proteolyticus]KAH8693515.1 hypothetical protein BGW36DRAFT_383174 [Talaromyces proteolyticus]